MKKSIIVLLAAGLIAIPAIADKPEWAGKGKPTDAEKAHHKAEMTAKGDDKEHEKKLKERKNKEKRGLETQHEKKSQQAQKELGKGSDKGQESREQRKKWWKFWGE